MEISITVPDEIARKLEIEWRDLPRHTLEALAVDAYRHELLTAGQVRELLGLPTRLDVDALLKRAGAHLLYDAEDLADDRRMLEKLLAG